MIVLKLWEMVQDIFFLFMLEETVLDIDESFGLSTFKGLFSYFCSFHVCWAS